jgi:hypothetical protein
VNADIVRGAHGFVPSIRSNDSVTQSTTYSRYGPLPLQPTTVQTLGAVKAWSVKQPISTYIHTYIHNMPWAGIAQSV